MATGADDPASRPASGALFLGSKVRRGTTDGEWEVGGDGVTRQGGHWAESSASGVISWDIEGKAGSISWDIRSLKEGVYLYFLKTDKHSLSTRRLVIVR